MRSGIWSQGMSMRQDGRNITAPQVMTAGERVKLLDATMHSCSPEAFLDGMQSAFDLTGRQSDALMAAMLRSLLQNDEIEIVMHLRAEWLAQRA